MDTAWFAICRAKAKTEDGAEKVGWLEVHKYGQDYTVTLCHSTQVSQWGVDTKLSIAELYGMQRHLCYVSTKEEFIRMLHNLFCLGR